jgi:hypothetical protein
VKITDVTVFQQPTLLTPGKGSIRCSSRNSGRQDGRLVFCSMTHAPSISLSTAKFRRAECGCCSSNVAARSTFSSNSASDLRCTGAQRPMICSRVFTTSGRNSKALHKTHSATSNQQPKVDEHIGTTTTLFIEPANTMQQVC